MRRPIFLNEIKKSSVVKERKSKQLERKLNIKRKEDIPIAKEILKQKIQAQRLRRMTKRSNFFRQNKIFKEGCEKVLQESWGKKNSMSENHPPLKKLRSSGAIYGRTAKPIMSKLLGSNKNRTNTRTW